MRGDALLVRTLTRFVVENQAAAGSDSGRRVLTARGLLRNDHSSRTMGTAADRSARSVDCGSRRLGRVAVRDPRASWLLWSIFRPEPFICLGRPITRLRHVGPIRHRIPHRARIRRPGLIRFRWLRPGSPPAVPVPMTRIDNDPTTLNKEKIQAIVRAQTGRDIDLDAPQVRVQACGKRGRRLALAERHSRAVSAMTPS